MSSLVAANVCDLDLVSGFRVTAVFHVDGSTVKPNSHRRVTRIQPVVVEPGGNDIIQCVAGSNVRDQGADEQPRNRRIAIRKLAEHSLVSSR